MFKNILLSGLLCTFLSAESFDTFLQKAIQSSPYLESSNLAIKQTVEKGSILTRYKNPTLELEYSSFSPDLGRSDNGYRLNYSQPIRLWNVTSDNESLSRSMLKRANALYSQNKAVFTRDISLNFTFYAQQQMLLKLGDEELRIAKTIYDISNARYEKGTISRGLMLQAKIDYENTQIRNEFLYLSALKSYYALLRLAGINEELNLDTKYSFTIATVSNNTNNPDLKILQASQEQSLSQAKVNSNKISWMSVYAEYEADIGQDIARAGINFPLAFFNTKKEEKTIATLQANRSKLILENESNRLSIDTSRLKKERISLKNQEIKNKEILDSEIELLGMFQQGYKIASINLLQLQDIKNRVISTKRNLIIIKSALNKNAIYTNYNQGLYND